MTSKKCTKCGVDKPLAEFGDSKDSTNGKKYWCRPCCKDYNQARYTIKKSLLKRQSKDWAAANKDKVRGYRIKCLEKKKAAAIQTPETAPQT